MTVLLVSLQAKGEGVPKSKPCSLREGWGSVGSRGMWANNSLRGGGKPFFFPRDLSSHNKLECLLHTSASTRCFDHEYTQFFNYFSKFFGEVCGQ